MINRKVFSGVARVTAVSGLLVWCVMARAEQVGGEQKFMEGTFHVVQSGSCSVTPPEKLEVTQDEVKATGGKLLGNIRVECTGEGKGYQSALAVSKLPTGPYDTSAEGDGDFLKISLFRPGEEPDCKQLGIAPANVTVNCWITSPDGPHEFPFYATGSAPISGSYIFYLIGAAYMP